jgi:C4-dicarboxylate-binding protein DctP
MSKPTTTVSNAPENPSRRAWSALLATTALSWGLGSAAFANAQKPILIKFSHVVKPETAKGRAALRFKELAERRTAGRVRVEIYPDNQLYQDREEISALKRGTVQMLAPSLSKLAELGGNDFEAFDLPFLFNSKEAFRALVDGPVGADLLKRLERSGVKGLAFWDNGFKVFTANRPLHSPQDLQGLRFRVQSSQVLSWQMEVLGAKPSVMPLERVPLAMKRHELDGQENVPSNVYTQGLYQLQSDLTVSNHGYLAYAVIVNKPFWDNLPSDIRSQLESALQEATTFANAEAHAENQRALERMAASGGVHVYVPTAPERLTWKTAMAPTYDKAKARISPAALAAIRSAMGDPP